MKPSLPPSLLADRRDFLLASLATLGFTGRPLHLVAQDKPGSKPQRTADTDIREALTRAPLSMLFKGSTPAEFRSWHQKFATKLSQLLGDSSPPTQWTVKEESRQVLSDHTRLEFLLQSPGIPPLPIYLLIPSTLRKNSQAPAVVCVHGHGAFANDAIVGRRDLEGIEADIKRANYDYGLQFVKRGYVVAAPCMRPFGRRVDRARYGGNDPCAVNFVRMQSLGQLPITANIRDLRWAIDLLQSRPEVSQDKIGCAGLSYGGRMTMMVTAVDSRIRVASVSGALNLLQERMSLRHSCGSQLIPSLLNYGDYSEIGSLIAPRPCVWEVGSEDKLVVPKWDEIFKGRLRRAYQAAGVAKNLHFDHFEGGHRWSGRIAFPLFDQVLKS
ncbi:MAG: alpha/beta hydrolase family protein [Pirellulaceae bacterium]